ncbi:serine/threonine-protein kinase [Streptomyces sp. A1136]|uniref:serine/threonine-protein kinase n=1 Tax=Streptomyces sp. A1136 TaxID=2563102 RepID=UPI00109E62DF|nr:serine/threonine-protein kinase [Streptomyces sp. A1136]THA57258.1 serine/threonine protein kinase [Streptomyces sp. A1136]
MTTHPFRNVTHAAEPEALLDRLGTVFRRFDEQDSGCVSYGLLASGRRWFVKTAATAEGTSSLRRAASFHRKVAHPAVVPLVHTFTTDERLVLVYPWVSGEVLYHPTRSHRGGRAVPGSPMARFRARPLPLVHAALESVLRAHVAVEEAGFVAVDLYDGCLLYDFDLHRMVLCDLDEYRPGPFVLDADRLPGSTRYMAPEQLVRGSLIDTRATVFTLGRTLRLLLDAGDEERRWRGNPEQLEVIGRATAGAPERRFPSVGALVDAWRVATGAA